MAVTRRALVRASSQFSSELLSRTLWFVNSRVITVVAAGCSVLYLSFWALALLQNRGIIQTKLPIPVSDEAIIERSHLELVPDQVSQEDIAQRAQLIAEAQAGPSSAAVSPLTLDIEATAPVQLRVSDASGQATGLDPFSGASLLGIPEGLYSGQFTNPQLISLRHAMGIYRVQLIGSGTGSYTLTVRLMMDGDLDHALQYVGTGRVFQDTVLQTTVTVGLADEKPQLMVSDIDALTATLANPSDDTSVSSAQPDAVVRLKPPESLPLPLPGVVLPPNTPALWLPDGPADASAQQASSSPKAANFTTTTVTWDAPPAPADAVSPSSSVAVDGGASSGSDTASSPAEPVATAPAALPTAEPASDSSATIPTSAATPISSSAPAVSTSNASPVATQAGGSQASPVATPAPDATATPTPSPTGSGSQSQTNPTPMPTRDPTADPTPAGTAGSGQTGGGSGSSSGASTGITSSSGSTSGSGTSSGMGSSGAGGGGSPLSNAGGSNSGKGSSHAESAPGHAGDPGRSGSAPGHTGTAGLSGSAPGKAK